MKGRLHYIEADLGGVWISLGLMELERYLTKWARFSELHGV